MKFVFTADKDQLKRLFEEMEQAIAKAGKGAVQDAADEMVAQGRANIAAAAFSSRWQQGLKSKLFINRDGDPGAVIFHRIGFASVFETGATISGKDWLWLPIRANLPSNIRSPRKYGRKLVSVNVAGHPPMLFDAQDRKRGPLFFGVRSVQIRKRWDLLNIFERIAERLGQFYEARMKKD